MSDPPTLIESRSRQVSFTLAARIRSLRYAGRGIALLLRDEHNAWLHLCASAMVPAAGYALDASLSDWRWLILAIAIVWMAEAFNTAVERLCDRVCPHPDPTIGTVKDLAAGGVLIAAAGAAAIGVSVLGPPLLARIG